jgi:hypothetical protein
MGITLLRKNKGAATSDTQCSISIDLTNADSVTVQARDTGASQLITGVALDTVPPTPIPQRVHVGTSGRGVTIYGLKKPPTGVHNVIITYASGATNLAAVVSAFACDTNEIDFGVSNGYADAAGGGSGTGKAVTIGMSAGSVAVDAFVLTKGDSTVAPTPGGSQTLIDGMLETGSFAYVESSYLAGATQMSWNWNGPSVQPQALAVLELKLGPVKSQAAPDNSPPTESGTVTFTNTGTTGTTATWPAGVDDVALGGYKYRLNGGAWIDAAVGTATSKTLSGLASGTQFTMDVEAYDTSGNPSTGFATGTFTTLTAGNVPTSKYFVSAMTAAPLYAERARDTTHSTGPNSFVVDGVAPTGLVPFGVAFPTPCSNISVVVAEQNGPNWVEGLASWDGANLTLTQITGSSNGGNPVTFGTGPKDVVCGLLAYVLRRMGQQNFIDLNRYPVDPLGNIDSTEGVQAAINDAFISGRCTIKGTGRFKIAGAIKTIDAFGRNCNAQIYIPASDNVASMRHICIEGHDEISWSYGALSDMPLPTGGLIFESTLTAGSGSGNTAAAVIGASEGYATPWGTFSFTDFTLRKAIVRVNTSQGANSLCGINLYNLANGGMLDRVRVEPNVGLLSNPDASGVGSFGIITARTDNSGQFLWNQVFVGGFTTAVRFSEHMCINRLTIYGCLNGVDLQGTYHASSIEHLNIEGCKNNIVQNGDHALSIGKFDTEHNSNTTWRAFARDVQWNAGLNTKITILSSHVVKGGVGIAYSDWSANKRSDSTDSYKVVSGAGAN